MQFLEPAPANLTQDGTTFYADWSVADTNFGYTKAEVESWISTALNNPLGIETTGIITRQVTSGNVIFQVLETVGDKPGILGVAHWNEFPVRVELEAGQFGNPDLVTHEAMHAFLLAEHSPEGTDSILEPIEELGSVEWLSPSDISQIEAWLAGAPADLTYWFPGDLEHYITQWPIASNLTRTRIVATVIDGSSCVLKAVWGSDHLAMVAGEYSQFGRGLELGRSGFVHTPWQAVPAVGDTYVGLIIDGATTGDFDRLVIAHAEVQIVGAALTGGGSPIPN